MLRENLKRDTSSFNKMTLQVTLYIGNCYKCSYLYLGPSKVSVPGHCIRNTGLKLKLSMIVCK